MGSRGYECTAGGAPELAHLAGGLGCSEAVSEQVGMGQRGSGSGGVWGLVTSQQGCSTESSLVYT